MAISDLDVDRERLGEICTRYGVARLDVFGSVGRGEATPESDVDVLYELAPGARLGWEIENLADELSEVVGRPVDLVSRRTLHPRLRDAVLAEAKELYAAAARRAAVELHRARRSGGPARRLVQGAVS